jgi:hypothetical protein
MGEAMLRRYPLLQDSGVRDDGSYTLSQTSASQGYSFLEYDTNDLSRKDSQLAGLLYAACRALRKRHPANHS